MSPTKLTGIIKKRYSCRSYMSESLSDNDRVEIEQFLSKKISGPFGTVPSFMLLASEQGDSSLLKNLGTYGFIRNPAAFIAGAVTESDMSLEDYGYCMEQIVLKLTSMGLGTCWIGGSFKKSAFALRAGIKPDEILPAVVSIGYIAAKETITDRIIKAGAGSKKRKNRDELFFDSDIKPLIIEEGDKYNDALEMVRLGPSAGNMQPWRIIYNSDAKHFYFFLDRSAVYKKTNIMIKRADLQRVDMGIAMCHFELTLTEYGIRGAWSRTAPGLKTPDRWEYIATWTGK